MKRVTKSFLGLFFISSVSCSAQLIKPEILFGKWKVENWLFFENLKETTFEHAERIKDYQKCLKAEFIIDTNGIKVLGSENICYFDPCNYNFSLKK